MRRLGIGVAGLGRAFSLMIPTFTGDDRVALVAAADPRPEARARFASQFGANTYETVADLCADRSVDIVYVATPHQLHAEHAILAAQAGKHVLVEKPIAISIEQCDAIIAAARNANVHLVVGHSHSFDAPIARTRELIESDRFGAVRMLLAFNYTDFVWRPRRPEEFDTHQGGGAVFNQAAHQIDIVRLLAGSRVRTIRASVASWDAERPMDGAYSGLLTFESGAVASVIYSGYGHFDASEFQGWVGEMGKKMTAANRSVHRFTRSTDEAEFKRSHNYGGSNFRETESHSEAHQSFGTIIVSCEHADLRPLPDGVKVYSKGENYLDRLPPPDIPRVEVIDELYSAVASGVSPRHDGAWAKATLDVCLGMLRSSRENREVELEHQDAG